MPTENIIAYIFSRPALREKEKFLLNGDWLIDWPGELEAAGTVFSYSRNDNDSEALISRGPTKNDLNVMVSWGSIELL